MDTKHLRAHHKQFSLADVNRVFGEDYCFDLSAGTRHRSRAKRVVLVAESFFPRFDGVAQTVYATLRYLQATGREVLILAPDDAPRQIGPSCVIPILSTRVPRYPELRVGLPVSQATTALEKFQPDLIHLFAPVSMSIPAILYATRHHIPTIAGYETDFPRFAPYYGIGKLQGAVKRWVRYIHNRCNLTLAPSDVTAKWLKNAGFRHVERWHHGVNEQRFNSGHRSTQWRNRLLNGRARDSLLCIYVGRLAHEKNIESLREIAEMPGVALTIIGDGPARSYLESAFQGTGTYFTGYLLGHDLAAAFASADTFVFPSRTDTFGLVALEAMASGLPVVMCNDGGASDLVADQQSGFICDEPGNFAASVAKLRDDSTLRRSMAQTARRTAEQHSWSGAMAELETHYAHALALASEPWA